MPVEEVLLGFAAGEQHHPAAGGDRSDLLDDIETGEARHEDVEHDDVGLKGLGGRDGILGVVGLSAHIEAGLAEGGASDPCGRGRHRLRPVLSSDSLWFYQPQ